MTAFVAAIVPVLVTADASLTVIVAPRNAPVTSTSPSLSIVNAPAAVVVPALLGCASQADRVATGQGGGRLWLQ